MAELPVGLIIDKLGPLLKQETKLLKDVYREVDSMKNELESIQSFLREADRRMVKGDNINDLKTWVKQVREVAYRIEDVIDEYTRYQAWRHWHSFIGLLHKVVNLIVKLKLRHDIGSEIQDIRTTIQEIKYRSTRYEFTISQGELSSHCKSDTQVDPRMASLFIEEDEVVGIESMKKQLIGWLEEGASKRTTMTLMGMGGIGKTTLAKKVDDSQIVAGHCECHAWIAVSQSYKEGEVLKTIIKQLYQARKEPAPEEINTLDLSQLIIKLREYLKQRRYLIVFYDVWNIRFWGFIKLALPDHDKACRIIITTHHMEVALYCKESLLDHVQELQPLPHDKAWELFCRKAFQSYSGGHCPPELESLSVDIVGRCEGLPLAIVAIGRLLSTKDKTVQQWQTMRNSLRPQLERNPQLKIISEILSLSYHDLPYSLKSCLLYFGLFPQKNPISCNRLIRLWIAEHFVKAEAARTLEEIAEE